MRGVPLAWRNLIHDKRRFAVSVTGIGFAVVLMFVELGFWNAMLDAAVELLAQCKGDLVIVSKATYTLAIRESFPTQRLDQAHGVPGVEAAVPLYFESTNSLWRDSENQNYDKPRTHPIRVIAFDPAYDAFKIPEVAAQRLLLRGANAVLMDTRSKQDYGKHDAPLDRELSRRHIEVVGTFALGADFTTDGNLLMSADTFARFFPNPLAPRSTLNLAHLGLIQLAPGVDRVEMKKTLRALLPDDVHVLTMDEFIRQERRFWQIAAPAAFSLPWAVVAILAIHLAYPLPFVPSAADRVTRQTVKYEITKQIRDFLANQPEKLPVYVDTYQWTALLRFQGIDARQIAGVTRPSHFTQIPEAITDSEIAYVIWEGTPPERLTRGFAEPTRLEIFPLKIGNDIVTAFWLWRYEKIALKK